jgi:hypothetical protein
VPDRSFRNPRGEAISRAHSCARSSGRASDRPLAPAGETGRPRRTRIGPDGARETRRQLGPTRLPRGFQVEQGADVSRVQMPAGLRAYELSGRRRVPTLRRFPDPDGGPVRCAEFVFSITAAGQPRMFAGFPFQPSGANLRAPARTTTYGGSKSTSTETLRMRSVLRGSVLRGGARARHGRTMDLQASMASLGGGLFGL